MRISSAAPIPMTSKLSAKIFSREFWVHRRRQSGKPSGGLLMVRFAQIDSKTLLPYAVGVRFCFRVVFVPRLPLVAAEREEYDAKNPRPSPRSKAGRRSARPKSKGRKPSAARAAPGFEAAALRRQKPCNAPRRERTAISA